MQNSNAHSFQPAKKPSKKETLERKDNEAKEGKILRKSGEIFKRPEITRKEGYVQKYEQLMKENRMKTAEPHFFPGKVCFDCIFHFRKNKKSSPGKILDAAKSFSSDFIT